MSSEDNQEFIPFCVQCPHCDEYIYIEKLNCSIFRHGVMKKNNKQIDPHSSKEICDKLFKDGKIYGCGKPFKIENVNNVYITVICDYI
jgi:phage terminase large subunit GpA-like protein